MTADSLFLMIIPRSPIKDLRSSALYLRHLRAINLSHLIPLHRLADRLEAELVGRERLGTPDEDVRRVVCRLRLAEIRHMALEELVERVHLETHVGIDVGDGEEVTALVDFQARLFAHFAGRRLFARLVHVDETAREVERPLARFLRAAHQEQFARRVADKASHGRRGVKVIDKAAMRTHFRLLVPLDEGRLPADGAIRKLV